MGKGQDRRIICNTAVKRRQSLSLVSAVEVKNADFRKKDAPIQLKIDGVLMVD